MVRKRRTYTAEQKADAVRLVREVGSYAQVARDLGIDRTVIRAWVLQAQVDAGEDPPGHQSSCPRRVRLGGGTPAGAT